MAIIPIPRYNRGCPRRVPLCFMRGVFGGCLVGVLTGPDARSDLVSSPSPAVRFHSPPFSVCLGRRREARCATGVLPVIVVRRFPCRSVSLSIGRWCKALRGIGVLLSNVAQAEP